MTKNKLIVYWASAQTLGILASSLGMSWHVAHSVQTALFILNMLVSVSAIVLFYNANTIAPTSWRSRAVVLAVAVTAVFMLVLYTSLNL